MLPSHFPYFFDSSSPFRCDGGCHRRFSRATTVCVRGAIGKDFKGISLHPDMSLIGDPYYPIFIVPSAPLRSAQRVASEILLWLVLTLYNLPNNMTQAWKSAKPTRGAITSTSGHLPAPSLATPARACCCFFLLLRAGGKKKQQKKLHQSGKNWWKVGRVQCVRRTFVYV